MNESTALAVLEKAPDGETPTALMRRATDVAGVCREIVMRTAMTLQGKKYVKVEGWMSIAAAYGCVPSIREVVEEERGIKAIAELKRHDGTVLATAEGYVGLDEPRWANQALYARRGMAQTRAISRVCRSVFAFCVVLIDENLQTTPAEEIPMGGQTDTVDVEAKPVTSRPLASMTPQPGGKRLMLRDKAHQAKYPSALKDKFLCDMTHDELKTCLNAAKKSVDADDPKWRAQNKAWLATVQEEVQLRITWAGEESGRIQAPKPTSAKLAKTPVDPPNQVLPFTSEDHAEGCKCEWCAS